MLIRLFKALFRRYPADARVARLRSLLMEHPAPLPDANGPVVAIQCIEDPLYFGLFGAVYSELRTRFGMRGELVLVHSISGFIGTGPRASLLRSSLFRLPLSSQWVRAFQPLVCNVAYRCVSLGHPVADAIDAVRGFVAWRRARRSPETFALEIDDIPVGDLIIDSYLRFRPAPHFEVADRFVLRLIWQAYRDVRRARRYFATIKPALYLTSYSTYLEHGIPVRVALKQGTDVRAFGSLLKVGKELTWQDWFHAVDTANYRRRFETLDHPEQRLQQADEQLSRRFTGQIDQAMSYMRQSAYASNTEELPPDLEGAVVVFMHDFFDSPHIYADLVFDDFWSWICFTIDALREAKVPFYLKPHPNQIELSKAALAELCRRYPEVRLLSTRINAAQLAKARVMCGVTVYGSVAHELAYFGVPTVACARHPHASFEFCRTARTRDEYHSFLQSPATMPLDAAEMRRQALMFYYMHNLYGDPDELALRADFVAFWTACNSDDPSGNTAAQALQRLRTSRAFGLMVEAFAKQLGPEATALSGVRS